MPPSTQKPHPLGCVRKKGFTLIEILSALAIVAILMAILIPTIGKMRASANQAKCVTNLRQLVIASKAYGNEHNGNPPYPNLTNDLQPTYAHAPHYYEVEAYDKTLAPYLGDRFDSMYCPGEISNDPVGSYDPDVQRQANNPNSFVSYQYFHGDSQGAPSGNAKAEYSLLFSNMLNAPEAYAMWGCLTYVSGSRVYGHIEGRSSTGTVAGMNAAYADGSVQWVTFENLEAYTADGSYLWPKSRTN